MPPYRLRGAAETSTSTDTTTLSSVSTALKEGEREATNFVFTVLDIFLITAFFVVVLIFPIVSAYTAQKTFQEIQSIQTKHHHIINVTPLLNAARLTYTLTFTMAIVAGVCLLMWLYKFVSAARQ